LIKDISCEGQKYKFNVGLNLTMTLQ